MSQSTRKTWVSILIAAVIIVGMLAITVVGGTAYFFYRHIHAQFTGVESAERQFAEARARFEGRQPLIEIQKGEEPVLHRELMAGPRSPARLDSLRVLAYAAR